MPYSLFSTGVVKVWYTNYIELFSCWMSDWQYAQFQSLKLGHWLKTLFEGQKSVELYIVLKITDMFIFMMSPMLSEKYRSFSLRGNDPQL